MKLYSKLLCVIQRCDRYSLAVFLPMLRRFQRRWLTHRDFGIKMKECAKVQCSYCGNLDYSVGEKPIKRFSKLHGIIPRVPICTRCFLEIKKKTLPLVATMDEVKLAEKATLVKNAAYGLSKQTPMHRINELCCELDEIIKALSYAIKDFDVKARLAEQAARKIEWLRETIDSSKVVIEQKLHSSYQNCRMIASRCCSDQETRNYVFGRDGNVCVVCGGNENLSIDHIRPVRHGGSNDFNNLQTLCVSCNSRKGSKFSKRISNKS